MAAHTTTRVDLVFVANGKVPESVAVSASSMVPEPRADNKILDNDGATCDPLQRWGIAIEEETRSFETHPHCQLHATRSHAGRHAGLNGVACARILPLLLGR